MSHAIRNLNAPAHATAFEHLQHWEVHTLIATTMVYQYVHAASSACAGSISTRTRQIAWRRASVGLVGWQHVWP